jgi:hypothetical protein
LISTARHYFTSVLQDVVALCKFRETQVMQRGAWEAQIPAAVKARFIQWNYVRVTPNAVYLTAEGLEVLEYRQATA